MAYTLNKRNDIISHKKLYYLSKSDTGTVYRYNGKAIHIFPDNVDGVFSEEEGLYLTNLDTHRILLPDDILYKNKHMVGFTTTLPRKNRSQKLINSDKTDFLYSLYLLEEDVDVLSKHRVLMSGLVTDKSLYNGDLYLLDPSKYGRISMGEDTILKLNLYQLHLLISKLLMTEFKKNNSSYNDLRGVEELLQLREQDEYPSKFFNNILEDREKVKSLVRKV